METKTTYRIPDQNLWKLNHNLGKLNKRAAKLGLTPIVLTEVGTEQVEIMEKAIDWAITGGMEPTGRFRVVHIMSFTGVTPKLAGWSLQATIEQARDEEGKLIGNMVRTVPGVEGLPAQYREAAPWCDHCKTNRRRLETFIVKNENGTFKQIGRNCLVDFLGGADPAALMEGAEFLFDAADLLSEAEDEGFGGGSGYVREYVSLRTVLEVTGLMMRHFGWTSRKAESENEGLVATARRVQIFIFGNSKDREESYPKSEFFVTEQDTLAAEQAIEWAKTLNGTGENEYRYNLSVIARAARVDYKGLGFAASMLASHKRELGTMEERKRSADADAKSVYVGIIGEKIDFEAVVEKVILTASDWGALNIHKMRTTDGNILTWFASSAELTIGETYKLTGTVKKHEEYRGAKQTVVTRVKEYVDKAAVKAAKKQAAVDAKLFKTIAWG